MPHWGIWLLPLGLAVLMTSLLALYRRTLEPMPPLAPKQDTNGGIDPAVFKKVRQLEFSTKKMVESAFSGEYHSVFKGRGMAFSEVRPYAPGDDVRAIDWNVTARFGEPFIKLFNEERELTVLLVVDASASGAFGARGAFKNETAAQLCAAIAFAAIRNNDKVGLYIFTDTVERHIPAAKGRRHVLRIIREILAFRPKGNGTSVKTALERLLHTARRRAIVFLVSDFDDAGFEPPLRVAAKKYDLIAVRIYDPAEKELPDAGLVRLRDPETGEELLADTGCAPFREAHLREMQRREADLKKMFAACGVDMIEVATDQPSADPLVRFFKRREKRILAGR